MKIRVLEVQGTPEEISELLSFQGVSLTQCPEIQTTPELPPTEKKSKTKKASLSLVGEGEVKTG